MLTMNRTLFPILLWLLLLLGFQSLSFAANFANWKAPAGAALDPAGGRKGDAALHFDINKEMVTDAWISQPQKIEGPYVRASAWMKAEKLYYLDFGFFAYGAVEFLDSSNKVIREESFIVSREIMLSEPLLFQRMESNNRHLSFDWRYEEKTIPVPQGAVQVRAKFGLSQRTTGKAWLDDVIITSSQTPEPPLLEAAKVSALPPVEVRLRNNKIRRFEDPLGHIFFPGEEAVFAIQIPADLAKAKDGILKTEIVDSENFPVWKNEIKLDSAADWVTVTVPKEIGVRYVTRYLTIRFETVKDTAPLAKTEFGFGYQNEFRRDQVSNGIEQRYIVNIRSNWNSARHSRFWLQRGDALTTCSLHIKNIWLDGSKAPSLENVTGMYIRPDLFHNNFNYSVVAIISGGGPNMIPEFSHLGHHALPDPESYGKFMTAAVKRFPHVIYWKALNETYRKDVPGYREAFVKCQKAFYDAVKAENPNAVVILDNSSVRDDAEGLFKAGLFNYCDAIDPHLYGEIEPTIFGFLKNEMDLLAKFGVKKRWISVEADPIPGAGTYGIEQRWVSEEIPKLMGSYFALGGEKLCLLGSGAITDPSDSFFADAHGGPNFTPTINHFAYRRFVDLVGLTPAEGSHVLGDKLVRYQRFDDKNKSVIVLWSVTGSNTVRIETKSDIRMVDNVRSDLSIKPSAGHCDVTVGFQPVYLIGAPDMKLALQKSPATFTADAGGLVVGEKNVVSLKAPGNMSGTISLSLPPGLFANPSTMTMKNGIANIEIDVPRDHEGQYITIAAKYGASSEGEHVVLNRFEVIKPVRGEIWSDASIKAGKPRYVVRISNGNPIPSKGHIIARAPATDETRPAEQRVAFEVAAKSSQNLTIEFPATTSKSFPDDEQSYQPVVCIYPDGGDAFSIREKISLYQLPKVKPGLRLDGDLSDWPSGNVHPVNSFRQYVPAQQDRKPGEISSEIQSTWDRGNLYFAVKVRGKDAEKSQGIQILLTNAQDKRMSPYEDKDQERIYKIKPNGNKFSMDAVSQSNDGHGVTYVGKRVPGGIDYEVAIPVWETSDVLQIDPDRWIRLSVAIMDTDGKSFWQWFGGAKEPKNYLAYGDFKLSAYGADEWGNLYGCPYAGSGRKRTGYVGVAQLPNGNRVRVKAIDDTHGVAEIIDAAGKQVKQFELPVGAGIHTIDVDRAGRLVVGDRLMGVAFYSLEDGKHIPLGSTHSFYPKRHIIEYRSQGYAQDQEGNYFISLVAKRREGPKGPPVPVNLDTRMAKIAGLTMFDEQGNEVKSFGQDIAIKNAFAPLHTFGNMGEHAGAFLYAESVAIDSNASLWVSDIDAKTLQVFKKTAPRTYDPMPMVYQAMPSDLYPCKLQSLSGGRVLVWNEKQMRIASIQNNAIVFGSSRNFESQPADLKVKNDRVLLLDSKGNIKETTLP